MLAQPGRSLLPDELSRLAHTEDLSSLDASQTVAACAIAGTDGLVTVTGPAGTRKTTMLRAAFAALTAQRRRMLVVAPTRKAASVASREVGAAASVFTLCSWITATDGAAMRLGRLSGRGFVEESSTPPPAPSTPARVDTR